MEGPARRPPGRGPQPVPGSCAFGPRATWRGQPRVFAMGVMQAMTTMLQAVCGTPAADDRVVVVDTGSRKVQCLCCAALGSESILRFSQSLLATTRFKPCE